MKESAGNRCSGLDTDRAPAFLRQRLPYFGRSYADDSSRRSRGGRARALPCRATSTAHITCPTMNPIEHKTVLVTGAGSGLGAAISRRLVGAGARVVLADINATKASRVAIEIDPQGTATMALDFDVSRPLEVSDAITSIRHRWGGLDVVINNAGTDVTAPIDEIDTGAWTRVLETNLLGPFLLVKAALPALRESDGGRGGHIVNVASTASLRAWPNASAYHASKWGLLGLSKAMHAELRACGVRVTSLIAGGMRTPFLLERFPDLDPALLQDPGNVAEAVLFLLSMPRGSVIAEIMVLPDAETSWP